LSNGCAQTGVPRLRRDFDTRHRHVVEKRPRLVPVNLEEDDRLARGQHTVLQTAFDHVMICLRDRRRGKPFGVVFEARLCVFRSRYRLPVDHFCADVSDLEADVQMLDRQFVWRLILANEGPCATPLATVRAVNADLIRLQFLQIFPVAWRAGRCGPCLSVNHFFRGIAQCVRVVLKDDAVAEVEILSRGGVLHELVDNAPYGVLHCIVQEDLQPFLVCNALFTDPGAHSSEEVFALEKSIRIAREGIEEEAENASLLLQEFRPWL